MTDRIPGGLAEGMSPSDFDQVELAKGIRVELEHTSSRDVAREIAMDHLVEDPQYYEKLAVMEGESMSLASKAWLVASLAGTGLCAYHGYRRHEGDSPALWALGWGILGGLLPVVAVPVALAQGFGERMGR